MDAYKVGVIQMNSSADRISNLSRAYAYIEEAAGNGAAIVTMPEVFESISRLKEDKFPEKIPGPIVNKLMELAKKHKIWIHGGSIREENPEEDKYFNTTVLISPKGKIAAKYSKLHLFDVDIQNGPSIKESKESAAGNEIVTVETELGHLGLSICYDVRFPELYRIMALRGAQVFFVPANFTHSTGMAHWEPLLRARAIENGAYVIAAAQTGIKSNTSLSHGCSMVIDPWGRIITQAEFAESLIYADIDLGMVTPIREQIPSLKNRRGDIYKLSD